MSQLDNRLWRPDLNAVVDWKAVALATQQIHGTDATWWIQATPGVNYYRADMPAKHLPGKTVRFETRDLQPDGSGGHCFPRQAGGTAIWMFPQNRLKQLLMAEMKNEGLRVLVEVDDNYTIGPPVIMADWRNTHKQNPDASYEAHMAIVSSGVTDGVIVSTPKLGEVYERFGKQIFICRNSVDPADWTQEPPHQVDDILRVGWAGSASHKYDLADIRPALDWASRQRDVQVVILGELDLGFDHWQIPWAWDLAQYRENVCAVDVMLCPIRASSWADCKSDIKALEAAMGGGCSIVSKTEPFKPWWADDRPCYVAETRKDYLKIVKHLVANREEVRETARLAREYAVEERDIKDEISQWKEAIAG